MPAGLLKFPSTVCTTVAVAPDASVKFIQAPTHGGHVPVGVQAPPLHVELALVPVMTSVMTSRAAPALGATSWPRMAAVTGCAGPWASLAAHPAVQLPAATPVRPVATYCASYAHVLRLMASGGA